MTLVYWHIYVSFVFCELLVCLVINITLCMLNVSHQWSYHGIDLVLSEYYSLCFNRLLHNSSLVAIRLSVGYETWPPIGWHHPFVIGWFEYRLGLPSAPLHYGLIWPEGIPTVLPPYCHWQPLRLFKGTVKESTVSMIIIWWSRKIPLFYIEITYKIGCFFLTPCRFY